MVSEDSDPASAKRDRRSPDYSIEPTLEDHNTTSSAEEENYTRVEVERIYEGPETKRASMQILQLPNPPIWSAWICLALAWLFLGSETPLTVFIGAPLDIAALFLGLTCLARGGFFTGIAVLFLGTAGSIFVYMIGLIKFISTLIF